MAFDELDRRIVAALVEDGRATFADIGGRVGLSAPAVKRRVDRLRASGAITGFSATVDPGILGWTTEAYVELFCRGRTSPSDIAALGKYPEVGEGGPPVPDQRGDDPPVQLIESHAQSLPVPFPGQVA